MEDGGWISALQEEGRGRVGDFMGRPLKGVPGSGFQKADKNINQHDQVWRRSSPMKLILSFSISGLYELTALIKKNMLLGCIHLDLVELKNMYTKRK